MEAMDGFTDALVAAMELGADLLGSVPLVARQQNLAAAQGEGVGRSQALFQGHQFLWIKLAHHYCSHASRMPGFLVLSTIQSWICTRDGPGIRSSSLDFPDWAEFLRGGAFAGCA